MKRMHRKPYDQMSKTARYLVDRERKGLPLPPSMRRGTLEYAKTKGWNSILQRTVNGRPQRTAKNESHLRKGLRIEFTKEEFCSWVDANWDKYEAAYRAGRTPSVDRIDNAKGYSLDNIQLIDLRENMSKDRKKPVVGTRLDTGKSFLFPSATDAQDRLGISKALISAAIKRNGTACGWSWRFHDV